MADIDSEQFSLRWNNFHSNLSSGFHSLLEEEGLVDVTLAAEGKFVQAHKLVLSVCSPYFKELFKVNPCKHPIVILKDVNYKELNAVLQFMYKGEVNVKQEELPTFLKTAELLQVKGLTGDEDTSEQDEVSSVSSSVPLTGSRPLQKPLPRVQPSVVKKPRSDMHIDPTDSASSTPPIKRMRPEVPPPAPLPVPVKISPSPVPPPSLPPSRSVTPNAKQDSTAINFVDVVKPKEEPIEIDSDIEETDTNISFKDESFMNLLGGESSHSQQDVSGMGIFGNFSSSTQEMLPQEAGQGLLRFVSTGRGGYGVIHSGFRYNINRLASDRVFWKCSEYARSGCRGRLVTVGSRVTKVSPHDHCRPDLFSYSDDESEQIHWV